MAPHDRTHVAVAVDHVEELGRVVEADLIEPAARHGNRVMMQADESVLVVGGAQRRIERRESFFREMTASGADQAAVEQHDAPVGEIHMAIGDERLAAQLAVKRRGLVVIAGNAQHRHLERTEDAAEMLVARNVVLHEIARDEHGIDRPLTCLRKIQRAHERGQRGHAAQRFGLAAVQVRISELYETDAHFQDGTHKLIETDS